jgi:nucleoside-diphosphate-sugar epimerase
MVHRALACKVRRRGGEREGSREALWREARGEAVASSVLFIGGTGTISSACVRRAVEAGFEVTVLNRGRTTSRPLPAGVNMLEGDIRDRQGATALLEGRSFDVVADFVGYTPEDVERDLELFFGRCGQFVFISSASAYQKPIKRLPITESTPLYNPFWQYSRDKIACEERLVAAYRQMGFPVTIVRPSHTYDRAMVPLEGGWTVIERMRRGEPVVVHGDGTSLWTLTHHDDFARAFVGLLGEDRAVGDCFHVTSDEVLTWDQVHLLLARAAGVEAPWLVHVTSEEIAALAPEWGPSLLGDKSHSVLFDNTKIRRMVPAWRAEVPFSKGAEEIVAWHDADASRRQVDRRVNEIMDALFDRRRSR